jgi:hypothetical protein
MKKFGFIIVLGLLVAGCQTTTVIDKQNVVIMPSNAMYNCPSLTYYPKSDTLTDIEVAKVIRNLYSNNVTCRNSLDAIHNFLNRAQRDVNNSEKKN